MKKTGIFYDSATGQIADIAKRIAKKLNVPENNVYCVDEFVSGMAERFELLLLGISTGKDGSFDKHWDKMLNILKGKNLSGKTIAFFGYGDSSAGNKSFYDHMKLLKKELGNTGAKFAGELPVEKNNSELSDADEKFVGVAIDEADKGDITEKRLEQWTKILNNNPNSQDF